MTQIIPHYKKVTDLHPEEEITPGSALCAGCGGLEGLRLGLKELGDNVFISNAAGCFSLLSVYPFTPFKGSWLYTTMGAPVPAAQGVRDALDIRRDQGKLAKEDDFQVMVVAGDGSSADMGLGPTSAAIHRNLDFIYFCYDNEAYGNTGFQPSLHRDGVSTGTHRPVQQICKVQNLEGSAAVHLPVTVPHRLGIRS